MSSDSFLSSAHKDNRLLDYRLIDKEWRHTKLPSLDIHVPFQEAPLPEGVGGQEAYEEGVCLKEVESVWRERLREISPPPTQPQDTARQN